MIDYGHELQFGIFAMPSAERPGQAIAAAKLADVVGLDLVTFQDHPYQARFLDTWTLLSYLAAETETVRLAPNVANLPLRNPAVLARSVASLDILSGGRIDLGLGAGAFWDGIAAMGGERLTPGESVGALSEAIDVIRSIWDTGERSARVDGTHHRLAGAHPGPAPADDVEIWLGAYKPRMLRLTGAKADGWIPSVGYAAIAELGEMGAVIDEGAQRAGRRSGDIRRMLLRRRRDVSIRRAVELAGAARRARARDRDQRVHPRRRRGAGDPRLGRGDRAADAGARRGRALAAGQRPGAGIRGPGGRCW